MVLKIASLVLLCGCLVAAKESDSQQKRQTYLGSPQANRYLSGDAYQLHQSRLTASLAQNEEQDSAAQAQIDEELRREAINNAKSAAELFKQSYRQSRVQPQQYPYATQEPAQQVQHYQLQQQQVQQQQAQQQQVQQQQVQQQQVQQQQVQQQHVAYAPTQAAPQEQNYQPVLQSVYQNTPAAQRLPANSQASIQSYQAHAQLAEEAAKAFQEALQQRSSRQKRPRLQNSQYILEQQHSFTVPEQTPEQYNLAAVQQAYQQIEEQQRQAAENIRSHETRPAAAPTAPTVQQAQQYEEPSLGYNIGDGPSDYEPARQRGQKKYQQQQPAQQELTVEIKPRRPSAVRSRPVVSQTYQAENPTVYPTEPATVAPAQYETANQVPYEIVQQYQPQTTQEPAVIPTYQPAPVVPSAPVAPAPARQPIRAPAAPTKPVFLPTPTPPVTRVAAPARVAAPVRAPVAAPQPVAATPTRVAAPVQVPQAYAAQAVAAPVLIPAAPVRIPAAPVQIPAAPAQYSGGPAGIPPTENIDGKLVNLDLNLLRSLYQAAETLAKKQKDDIGPISEDELIKALIEQGKREQQQAAEQLKKAQAEAEQRPKVEVVRIPKTKQITQEELQALIAAGYDITPIDEEPTAKNADPIKQQYLRQAEFLERQAQYRSQKPNTRRARDNRAQDEVAEE